MGRVLLLGGLAHGRIVSCKRKSRRTNSLAQGNILSTCASLRRSLDAGGGLNMLRHALHRARRPAV